MQPPGTTKRSGVHHSPIVLVGASARSAAESTRRAGFSPWVFDQFGDRETRQACVRWRSIDEAIASGLRECLDADVPSDAPIAIVGGFCNGYERWSNLGRHFYGADPNVFAAVDSPSCLRTLASQAEIRVPPTRTTPPIAPRGWLVKRTSSAGGLHVAPYNGKTLDKTEYLQRRERGRIVGASFLGTGGDALFLGACGLLTKRIEAKPFVFAGSVGPLVLPEPVVDGITRIGTAFQTRFPFVGPFNIDVAVNGEQATLLEINPRWSASMELLEQSWSDRLNAPCSFFESPRRWRVRLGEAKRCVKRYWKRIVFARRDLAVTRDLFAPTTSRWHWTDTPHQDALVGKGEPVATMVSLP